MQPDSLAKIRAYVDMIHPVVGNATVACIEVWLTRTSGLQSHLPLTKQTRVTMKKLNQKDGEVSRVALLQKLASYVLGS